MKNIKLKTGETAYVVSDEEKTIIELALQQFKHSLSNLESVDNG